MAKYKKYDYVKFTEVACNEHDFPLGCFVITDVYTHENGDVFYELYRQEMFYEHELYGVVKEDWIEKTDSPYEAYEKATSNMEEMFKYDGKLEPSEKLLNKKRISVLGTEYTIEEKSVAEDDFLKNCDGYCDKTSKRIVICKKEKDCELDDFEWVRKKTLRHEIVHAFFSESGLAENYEANPNGVPETIVDWIAIQSPKFFKVFVELGIL